ncbi:hypothetical protein ACHAWF_006737 [Thalassiosira exigua]
MATRAAAAATAAARARILPSPRTTTFGRSATGRLGRCRASSALRSCSRFPPPSTTAAASSVPSDFESVRWFRAPPKTRADDGGRWSASLDKARRTTAPAPKARNSTKRFKASPQPAHNHNHHQQQRSSTAPEKKKKKKGTPSAGQVHGRIAFSRGGKKTKVPQLCAGCGVEIGGGGGKGGGGGGAAFATGAEADDESRTKRQRKMARYAELGSGGGDRAGGIGSDGPFCERCSALRRDDVWKAHDALKDVDAEVFASQVRHIVGRRRFGLCVAVVDATDPEFSGVRKLRDVVKGVPCLLAINKADLLPAKVEQVHLNFLKSRVEKRGTKMIGAYPVSAVTGEGVVDLAEGILQGLGGRDVFVVGSANVGKSTLVKKLSTLLARTLRMKGKSLTKDDQRRKLLQKWQVTTSHLPGTTLQAIRVPCFPSTRHALWDTPGMLNKSAMTYGVFPSHLMEPLAKANKVEVPSRERGTKVRLRAGMSLLIEAGWIGRADGDNDVDAGGNDGDDEEERPDSDADEEREAKEPEEPFTLARFDVTSLDERDDYPLEILAYVPSCLAVRVVPTFRAPEAATMPKSYVDRTRALVGSAGDFDPKRTSVPFTVNENMETEKGEEGIVKFDDRDAALSGWIRQDVVFAGLGWLTLRRRGGFGVRPWIAKGSLWAKRRALYPHDLDKAGDVGAGGNARDDEDEAWEGDKYEDPTTMEDDDPRFEDVKMRLREAAETGRHKGDTDGRMRRSARRGGEEAIYGDDGGFGDVVDFNEDEWY